MAGGTKEKNSVLLIIDVKKLYSIIFENNSENGNIYLYQLLMLLIYFGRKYNVYFYMLYT